MFNNFYSKSCPNYRCMWRTLYCCERQIFDENSVILRGYREKLQDKTMVGLLRACYDAAINGLHWFQNSTLSDGDVTGELQLLRWRRRSHQSPPRFRHVRHTCFTPTPVPRRTITQAQSWRLVFAAAFLLDKVRHMAQPHLEPLWKTSQRCGLTIALAWVYRTSIDSRCHWCWRRSGDSGDYISLSLNHLWSANDDSDRSLDVVGYISAPRGASPWNI